MNFAGSWHENREAWKYGLIYPKLSDDVTPPGYAIFDEIAFVTDTRVTNGRIVRG